LVPHRYTFKMVPFITQAMDFPEFFTVLEHSPQGILVFPGPGLTSIVPLMISNSCWRDVCGLILYRRK